jgi:hypothetical protein
MIKSYKVIATQIERGYVVTSKKWVALYFLGVELSRCAEPNADSIEYIILIESAKLKKDVMEHHNDKGISMEHIQITLYILIEIALQPRVSIKKSKFLQHKEQNMATHDYFYI